MDPLRIAFFGPVNCGKSSLVNAIAGQEVSLVSSAPGTTTDPVRKRIELPGLGPCILIDTAGLDDPGLLGPERARLTRRILDETDIAVVIVPAGGAVPMEPGLVNAHTVIRVMAKADTGGTAPPGILPVSARTGEGIPELLRQIAQVARQEEERFLTGSLVHPGDSVLLVMPQDSEAPKGRLILPQVQVLRELLDRGCVPHCCTPDTLPAALASLGKRPDLVITDSKVFREVDRAIPPACPLTSFSILLAAAKGDIRTFAEGAGAIGRLQDGDRVLIAEACTHVPDTEDIGRVKIPALLRKKADIRVDIAAGNDFPEDLTPYALIIHCGACVANRALVQARIRKALLAGVPITNYGIALAKLQGILDRVCLP